MTDFQIGDYVWFIYSGADIYGTICTYYSPPDQNCYYVESAGDGFFLTHKDNLTLIHRPQASDHGATEYEEIMSLQSLSDDVK